MTPLETLIIGIIENKDANLIASSQNILPKEILLLNDNTKGHKNNFWHTIQVCQNVLDNYVGDFLPEMVIVAIWHDCGKPSTKRMVDGNWTFHNHELVSKKILDANWESYFPHLPINKDMVLSIIENHGRPKELTEKKQVTDSAIRRIVTDMGSYLDGLMFFANMDMTTNDIAKIGRMRKAYSDLKNRMDAVVYNDYVNSIQPALNGHILMEMGVEVRQLNGIKAKLRNAILAGEIQNTLEDCLKYYNNNND